MFGLFRKDPLKEVQKKIEQKYDQSIEFQRNGKIREYSQVMKEIDELERELVALRTAN